MTSSLLFSEVFFRFRVVTSGAFIVSIVVASVDVGVVSGVVVSGGVVSGVVVSGVVTKSSFVWVISIFFIFMYKIKLRTIPIAHHTEFNFF